MPTSTYSQAIPSVKDVTGIDINENIKELLESIELHSQPVWDSVSNMQERAITHIFESLDKVYITIIHCAEQRLLARTRPPSVFT